MATRSVKVEKTRHRKEKKVMRSRGLGYKERQGVNGLGLLRTTMRYATQSF